MIICFLLSISHFSTINKLYFLYVDLRQRIGVNRAVNNNILPKFNLFRSITDLETFISKFGQN